MTSRLGCDDLSPVAQPLAFPAQEVGCLPMGLHEFIRAWLLTPGTGSCSRMATALTSSEGAGGVTEQNATPLARSPVGPAHAKAARGPPPDLCRNPRPRRAGDPVRPFELPLAGRVGFVLLDAVPLVAVALDRQLRPRPLNDQVYPVVMAPFDRLQAPEFERGSRAREYGRTHGAQTRIRIPLQPTVSS